jgi:hypothetical protein
LVLTLGDAAKAADDFYALMDGVMARMHMAMHVAPSGMTSKASGTRMRLSATPNRRGPLLQNRYKSKTKPTISVPMNAAWLSLQATFSPWGREYARTLDRYVFGTAPSEFARAVAPFVRPGDAVLDLGCGEGRDSVFFARLGAVVTGVDLSAEGLTKARRLARAHGVRGRWVHGSMTSAIPAGAFDLFHRLRTLTRPGGHQAHVVFTDRLIYREEGEAVDYFSAGELHEVFLEWQILARGDRVISGAQDGTMHGHAVEELVAARP